MTRSGGGCGRPYICGEQESRGNLDLSKSHHLVGTSSARLFGSRMDAARFEARDVVGGSCGIVQDAASKSTARIQALDAQVHSERQEHDKQLKHAQKVGAVFSTLRVLNSSSKVISPTTFSGLSKLIFALGCAQDSGTVMSRCGKYVPNTRNYNERIPRPMQPAPSKLVAPSLWAL